MRQVIEFMIKFGNWLFRFFIWLIVEPKRFWITLLPIFIGVIFIWVMPTGIFNGPILNDTLETRFRLTGLILEVLGIGTVVYGLNETLKLFLGEHLLHIINKWFKRFPKFGVNSQNLAASLFANSSLFHSPYITTSLPLNSSIENRVTFLEEQLKQVHLLAHENRLHFENELKKLADALIAERIERENGDKQAQQVLKEFAVGDVFIELMGVIWLIMGAIFATASTELAKIFG